MRRTIVLISCVKRKLGQSAKAKDIYDSTLFRAQRTYAENAIGLLAGKEPASPNWLGRLSGNDRIVRSHLWNVNHIDHRPDPNFLSTLESVICEMTRPVKPTTITG